MTFYGMDLFCYHPGNRFGKRQTYNHTKYPTRTNNEYLNDVNISERTEKPSKGIKGNQIFKKDFLKINNLHQVYKGKTFLHNYI